MQTRLALLLLVCITQYAFSANILVAVNGGAGHVRPIAEVAKHLVQNGHSVTFATQKLAEYHFDFNSVPFKRIIWANESQDAAKHEYQIGYDLFIALAEKPAAEAVFDAFDEVRKNEEQLLIKLLDAIEQEHFDLVLVDVMYLHVQMTVYQKKIPMVLNIPTFFPTLMDINKPAQLSALSLQDLTSFPKRLYGLVEHVKFLFGVLGMFQNQINEFKKCKEIPQEIRDGYTLGSLFETQENSLQLYTTTLQFNYLTTAPPNAVFLGPYISEGFEKPTAELQTWVNAHSSIVLAVFGTTSRIKFPRMKSLILGLIQVVHENPTTSLLLALAVDNYETMMQVLKEEKQESFLKHERVNIVQGLVPQKWLLQQKNVKVFISHGGMNSVQEALYYGTPVLVMPFQFDQVTVGTHVQDTHVGLTLYNDNGFNPLLHIFVEHSPQKYHFTEKEVATKLNLLIRDKSFANEAVKMSKTMRHAGGTKRAVDEIEFVIDMKGDMSHTVSILSRLPFYQRYAIDIALVVLGLGALVSYLMVYIVRLVLCRATKKKQD
jgi:UDP:flavonoid glycosyltransferase YjiC (YdhE family)